MGYSLGLLFTCAALALSQSSSLINDSSSPDGKYTFVAKSLDKRIVYQLQSTDGTAVSDEISSDFGILRSLEDARDNTSVHWRPDGNMVIVSTDHDRHHVDFIILRKTSARFEAISFSWETLTKFAQLKQLGFGYPAFLDWLPNGHALIDLFESDGSNTTRESKFEVDLAGKVNPVSWKIIQPEQKVSL